MATTFPTTIDSFTNITNPTTTTLETDVGGRTHSEFHNDYNDALEALETKVGANGSVDTASHTYKIATLETQVTTLDAQNVKLSGNQTVAGNKTFTGSTTLSGTTIVTWTATFSNDVTFSGNVTIPWLKFGGTSADWAVNWTSDITITGSNNTLIEKNYSSWTAGTAPRTFTVTPTGCILYIRIKGNADFSNWTFNLAGKWAIGGTAVTYAGANLAGNNGASSVFFINWGGSAGLAGGQGGGGGASPTTNGGTPIGGGGGGGVTSWKSANIFELLREYSIDCGAGGASGAASNTGNSGAGGNGGGCIIIEVGWNLTLTGSAITVAGSNWANAVGVGCGGGGGGGGGGSFIIYGGTLTGTVTPTVTGGTGGTGNTNGWAGGAGIARIYKNTYTS